MQRLGFTSLALSSLAWSFALGCSADGPTTVAAVGTGGSSTDPGEGTGGAAVVPGVGQGGAAGDSGPLPESADFELVFHDDFDELDLTRWQKAEHSFAENAAQFVPEMVTVDAGQLVLRMEPNPVQGGENPYISGELRTIEHFSYGRFEVRAKFAAGSGLVGSLFTYYDHWAVQEWPENWNELDIEYLGGTENSIQFNVIHWNANDNRTTHEHETEVAFDPTAGFHNYAIEWLPSVVNFYINGQLVHSQTDQIAEFVTLEQRMMMNLWPVIDRSDLNSWAGQFDDSVLPVESRYEWARLSQYVGQ